jgi:DNA repair protein RecO (recombination protein O)
MALSPLTLSALILASYDVGEADRFIVLLTRERGRIAARVPGARRTRSKLGALLPLSSARLEVKETKTGFLVTGIAAKPPSRKLRIAEFLCGMQVCELLLSLLSDEEPVPEIYDATVEFLNLRSKAPPNLLAYSFRLLHLLGVLPETESSPEMARLSDEEKAFLEGCRHTPMKQEVKPTHRLSALCERLIAEHVTRPLRAPAVAAACR